MRALTCKDAIGLMGDYLEAILTPEALEELEKHLETCPPCQAYLNTYRRTRELTGMAGRVSMPAEMQARLREFLLRHLSKA